MDYMTNEKVAVLGAAGMIGSNMAQTLLATRTANNVALYDPFESGLEGVAEELYHCAFPEARVSYSTDLKEVLSGASYVLTSGGAPRKDGMTREDLLKGNAEIARDLGQAIKAAAPQCKLVVIIFNPADITGLVTLVHSGLPKGNVSTLAALDSTRLQSEIAKHFKVPQHEVTGCRTFGGHGESMAVFLGETRVQGTLLKDLLAGGSVNGVNISASDWEGIRQRTSKGGANIIKLRGRSSFQSPSQQSVYMLQARIGKLEYEWPCGAYINEGEFQQVMMGLDTTLDASGLHARIPSGSAEDMDSLRASYAHVSKLRDEVINMGILPPLAEWSSANPNL